MELLTDPQAWASLLTLTALEIVLGIDNIIFISIIASRLPESSRVAARRIGLGGALIMRIALLASLSWIIGLTQPVIALLGFELSWRDLILLAGGLFLLVKATWEVHNTMEGHEEGGGAAATSFTSAVIQIMLLDLVFSLDSVITAVGMARDLEVMIAAVVISMLIMLFAANPVGDFIHRHPTAKMLALSFLLLIGVALIADGLHFHIPRGYLYFAIAFSIVVECLNLLAAGRRRRLREQGTPS